MELSSNQPKLKIVNHKKYIDNLGKNINESYNVYVFIFSYC